MSQYTFQTTPEQLAEQAVAGVQPIFKDLIKQRLQAVADELMATAKADIEKYLAEVALTISKEYEAMVQFARYVDRDKIDIMISINKKPVMKRVEERFITEVVADENRKG